MRIPKHKYIPFKVPDYPERTWPSNTISEPPIWCSVDLRDGNQALINPMCVQRKLKMFNCLVQMGYKEIEVGFPSASSIDFDFVRQIIEQNLIPADVTIQVLTQCREHLITKTFAAVSGSKNVIIHFYNSTSELQRRLVFKKNKSEVKKIATDAARLIKILGDKVEANSDTRVLYEYSPESFTQTEQDYALEVCEAVTDIIQPSTTKPLILNLPATVEISTPNLFADRIEWFCNQVKNRQNVIISVHPHNDRGTATAAAELAILAGCDRVEGTLFGNGERTGNVDLITLGMNMISHGIDPHIDFSNMPELIKVVEFCNQLLVHIRHPYSGELVFTAFSGSHQDAIRKGMNAQQDGAIWEVPYLPIDPQDIGCSYEAIVRLNSQSGKGGLAYLMEKHFGILMPRNFEIEFSQYVQQQTEILGHELLEKDIWIAFNDKYLSNHKPFTLLDYQIKQNKGEFHEERNIIEMHLNDTDKEVKISGSGNGSLSACANAIEKYADIDVDIVNYTAYSVTKGTSGKALAFIEMSILAKTYHGVGYHSDSTTAAIQALIAAINLYKQANLID